MANRKYVVRDGFSFRIANEKGDVKVYSEGDSLIIDQEIGDNSHQLELLDGKKAATPPSTGGADQNPAGNADK